MAHVGYIFQVDPFTCIVSNQTNHALKTRRTNYCLPTAVATGITTQPSKTKRKVWLSIVACNWDLGLPWIWVLYISSLNISPPKRKLTCNCSKRCRFKHPKVHGRKKGMTFPHPCRPNQWQMWIPYLLTVRKRDPSGHFQST